jgi:Big-like domain-containing protein/NHL repeat-containing protein
MSRTHCSFVHAAVFAAAIAFISLSPANAQQPQPAISLIRPFSTESSLAPALTDNKAALDYREFASAKVGVQSQAEVFTLQFNTVTKVTGISATADFHVTGGTCIDGHTYSAGNVCSVDVAFTPKGPGHRTGALSITHTASATPFLTPIGGTAYGPVVSFIPAQIQTVPGTYSSGGTLLNPQGIAVDGGDNLYIADTGNNLIKFRDSSGTISTLVGGGSASAVGYSGFGSGIKLTGPRGVAVDYSGTFYISDTGDSIVLVRYIDGIINTRIGGGVSSSTCSFASPCLPYNIKITPPYSVATDPSGNLYTTLQVGGTLPGFYLTENEADNNNYYVLATTAYNYYSTSPSIGVDLYSNLYYTYEDPGGPLLSPTPLCYILAQNRAYSTSSAGQRFWTVAGSGKCGFTGDGGKATGAEISTNIGQFAFDAAGNLYFADTGNDRVRRVDVASGVIHTVAGNGTIGYGGDGGGGPTAAIKSPVGVAVDSMGQVYTTGLVSAANNAVIRQIGAVGQLAFPAQATGTHSPVQTILVSNTGNDTLNFIHFAITAGNTTEFAIDPNTTSCILTLPLYSGKNCNIGIFFTPAATGARSAVLTILDDTITGSNTINLTGTGALPAKAVLSPTTEAFSSQTVNTASAAKVLTLSNTGGLPFTINSYAFSGTNATDFTQTHTCGSSLNGAAACTISVVFKPIATGARSATFTMVTTAGTVTATLTGTGVAAAVVSKVTLSSKVNPAVDGQSVVLISTVAATSSAIPTGKVKLMEGTKLLAEADLEAGAATFKQLNLLSGEHILTATYMGDKLHEPSTSVPIQQVVWATNRRLFPTGVAHR